MRALAFLSFALSLRRTACLALLTPLLSLAQSPPVTADAIDAAQPGAPTAPLVHPSRVPQPAPDTIPSPTAWREAHDAVAAFPRGHADILAWEARQGSPAQPRGHGSHPMHSQPQGGKP